MKKKKWFIVIGIIIFSCFIYHVYKIKTARVIISFKKRSVEVYSKVRVSDLINNINGKIIDDKVIDTSSLGKRSVSFKYINDDNIKINYKFNIVVKDTTKPIISSIKNYYVDVGEKFNSHELFCGDNYDSKPKCIIKGKYDVNTPGVYSVKFIGRDSSSNESINNMNIIVREKSKDNNNTDTSSVSSVNYSDIYKKYKSKNNKIGIDVSHHQGDIDYGKIKKMGVDFVYIRVGRSDDGKFVLDSRFKRNIEGFNKEKIPVGVYFYSDADSVRSARREARWVLSKIKRYNVSLEVVFDWENWNSFQDYDLSFYGLTHVANSFSSTVAGGGYKSMVYSSKDYLENMWYDIDGDVWLAHYTDKTDYKGKYRVWQVCNNASIDGIDGLVDVDIRYK